MAYSKDRMPLGDITTSFLLPLERVLEQHGLRSRVLLERYGVSESQLMSRDSRISIPKFMRIGHDATQLTGDPRLGLRMGALTRISDFGLPGLAAMTAETIGESLEVMTRFERLNSHNSRGRSRYYLEPDGRSGNQDEGVRQHGIFHFYSISPYNVYNYFVVDFMLASIATLLPWLSGRNGLLERVEIEYETPPRKEQFEQFFGCPVHFSATRNALLLWAGRHQNRNQYANLATHRQLVQLCHERHQAMLQGQSVRQNVIELIGPELSSQNVSIDRIARKMGLASWSLRRRLLAEGYRFQDLLDETRKTMAATYVRDTQHNFTEIAYLLGFANPSGFQRAFRRWTGMSPGEYRLHNRDYPNPA